MSTFEKLWSKVDLECLILKFQETSTAAIALIDTNGIILWCNNRLAEVYEEAKKDLIGSHIGARVIYPKGIDAGGRIKQAIETGYTELMQTKWVTKSGEEKFMHQRIYRLDDKHGNLIGFWGIAYELTKEKRTINDSRVALRALTEMQKEEVKEVRIWQKKEYC